MACLATGKTAEFPFRPLPDEQLADPSVREPILISTDAGGERGRWGLGVVVSCWRDEQWTLVGTRYGLVDQRRASLAGYDWKDCDNVLWCEWMALCWGSGPSCRG